ncbi:MAG: hypothetical protein R2828_19625 [Saprospiraceae bacterium]
MQYQKITSGETIIEFHNNWMGEETVIINGQIVSKKSSVWGTHHHFTVIEKGHSVRYVLTTKVNSLMQVLLDLKRNGTIVHENIPVAYGTIPRKPENTAKKNGIAKLKAYELDEAIEALRLALDIDADDPEIYFYLACAYSVEERTLEGFESLKKAVEHKLQDTEIILNHDMLAFLRMHEAFETFLNSNFTTYDKALMGKDDSE